MYCVADGIQDHVTGVGDLAPDFDVVTGAGRRVTKEDYAGGVLVLNFWAASCAPCVEEAPSLLAFQRSLRGSGVRVLGISLDENENAYKAFLKRLQIDFETTRDPKRIVSTKYGTLRIPETYIIDKAGVVQAKIISSHDWMDPALIQFVKSLAE